MGGVPSTITPVGLFLEYPFPRISGVMFLKKPGRTSHAWHRFIWLVKIGGPLFVSRAKCMWKQINLFVTVLEQGRKVIDFYLIHSWFLDVKWGKSETQVDHIRPLHWGKTIKREHNTELNNFSHNDNERRAKEFQLRIYTQWYWYLLPSGTVVSVIVCYTKEPHSSYKEMMTEFSIQFGGFDCIINKQQW